MGPDVSVNNGAGSAELTLHAPGSHVASLRIEVSPDHRGKGVGRELVQHVLDLAHFAGIKRVEATPYVDNPGAVAFFDALDQFVWEGRRRKGGRRNGRLVDTYLFAWVDA